MRAAYDDGFLRRISYQGNEIVRMIYFALRDHNWNTMNHRIENENLVIAGSGFEVTYDCVNLQGGVTIIQWKGTISGSADGTIVFEINGKVMDDFRKNRAGFCVLHPLNVTGSSCSIQHDDGSMSRALFPSDVAPVNPFNRIQSMTWEHSGIPFEIVFEGDVFETEDQRNWGDASFKTFCTPLEKPFPVEMKRGDRIYQRITFKPRRKLEPAPSGDGRVELRSMGVRGVMPALGICASTEVERLSEGAIARLRALRLSHYRVDLHPSSDRFASDLSREYEHAFALGLPLEAVLHLTDRFPEEMEAFSVICRQNKVRLKKVLLLQRHEMATSQKIIDQMLPLKSTFPGVPFGGGTDYNFNELNKNRFDATNLDFISFSMDPQEHASDDLTILENAGSLEYLVRSARSIYGEGMPIHLSPIALRKRFNPYATNPADFNIDEKVKADPRQKGNLASLWTFDALRGLAKSNAAMVTLYQTAGNQGIVDVDGEPYPVYEIVRILAMHQKRSVEILESSDPFAVNAAVLDDKVIVMSNAASEEKVVDWNGGTYRLAAGEIKVEKLDRPK